MKSISLRVEGNRCGNRDVTPMRRYHEFGDDAREEMKIYRLMMIHMRARDEDSLRQIYDHADLEIALRRNLIEYVLHRYGCRRCDGRRLRMIRRIQIIHRRRAGIVDIAATDVYDDDARAAVDGLDELVDVLTQHRRRRMIHDDRRRIAPKNELSRNTRQESTRDAGTEQHLAVRKTRERIIDDADDQHVTPTTFQFVICAVEWPIEWTFQSRRARARC